MSRQSFLIRHSLPEVPRSGGLTRQISSLRNLLLFDLLFTGNRKDRYWDGIIKDPLGLIGRKGAADFGRSLCIHCDPSSTDDGLFGILLQPHPSLSFSGNGD